MDRSKTNDLTKLRQSDSYADPKRCCDVVMKGGISSGVVYPLAICEIAQNYSFCQIGGTSAGAIAAAATAAAEYRRKVSNNKDGMGFTKIADLPDILATTINGKTKLQRLFQPQLETRRVFYLANVGIAKGLFSLGFAWAIISQFPMPLLGLIPGLLIVLQVGGPGNGWEKVGLFVGGLALGTLLWVSSLIYALKKEIDHIGINNYGLCKGMETAKSSHSEEALMSWFSNLLDDIAGVGGKEAVEKSDPREKLDSSQPTTPLRKPLTFGELESKGITLKLMTTSISHGRPYVLPLEDEQLFFNPDQLKDYLPEHVIEWMKFHSPDNYRPELLPTLKSLGLLPLPETHNLPVAFAVRLSLSFPVLFAAVPLWAAKSDTSDNTEVSPCWFSDGGLTSNFPIHLFDKAVPKRPTFSINLRGFNPKDKAMLSEEVIDPSDDRVTFVSKKQTQGREEQWMYFSPPDKGISALFSFLYGAVESARNWQDNTLMRMAGQRDRIAHIALRDTEGGLNLGMGKDVVEGISIRGWYAAEKLVKKFDDPKTFEHHRSIRLQTASYGLIDWLQPWGKLHSEELSQLSEMAQAPQRTEDVTRLANMISSIPSATLPSAIQFIEAFGKELTRIAKNEEYKAGSEALAEGGRLDPKPLIHLRPKT